MDLYLRLIFSEHLRFDPRCNTMGLWELCGQLELLTDERIAFMAKTTGTVVLTLELLAIGNISDIIREKIKTVDLTVKATTPSVIESPGNIQTVQLPTTCYLNLHSSDDIHIKI